MAAYIIADVNVTDPVQYDQYRTLSTRAIEAHGATVIVRGGKTDPLEGRLPGRVVVLEFPSMSAARAFYDSSEYVAARDARANAAQMNMFIVDGIAA